MRPRTLLVLALLVAGAMAGCLSDGPAPDEASAPDGNAGGSGPDEAGAPDRNGTAPSSDEGNATSEDPASGPGANASEEGTSDDEPDGPDYATAFSNWGCRATFTMIEIRKAWAAQHTPEGFEPATFFPATGFVPQGPNRTVKASFFVASNHCDRVTLDGPGIEAAERSGVQRLYYGVFVDPPDRYEAGEKQYVYPFRFVTDAEADARLLSRWGLPAEHGFLDLAVNVDQAQARSWTVTSETPNASVRMDLETAGSTAAGDEPTTFRFFDAAEDGSVDRAMDYEVRVSNSTQNPVTLPTVMGGVIDLSAPDSPYPAPTPSPVAVTRWTPSEKVAQHAELVTFDG